MVQVARGNADASAGNWFGNELHEWDGAEAAKPSYMGDNVSAIRLGPPTFRTVELYGRRFRQALPNMTGGGTVEASHASA